MNQTLRGSCRLLLVLGAALMIAVFSAIGGTSAEASGYGKNRVTAYNDVLLRTYPQSWSIGTLFKGQHFDVQGYQSGYAWGYAWGSYNGCAWVRADALTKVGSHTSPDCGSKRRLRLNDYAHAPAKGYPDGRLTAKFKVTCQDAGLYGNYRGSRHLNRHYNLGYGTPVGWRYTTGDRRSAMVRYDAGNKWGFILRKCIGPR